MIHFLIGLAIGVIVKEVADQVLWFPPPWMSFAPVEEQTCGGGLRMECTRCGKTSHVMPGTRVRDAVAIRMRFLRLHVLCAGVSDDRGGVW